MKVVVVQLLKLQKLDNMPQVNESFIKEAHRAACKEWKYRIEQEFPTIFPPTHKIGTRYSGDGSDYILAQTGPGMVALISLGTGNRLKDPIEVKDNERITQEEFVEICARRKFVKV